MSGGTIYMVDKDGHLARMRPGAPANEDQMQSLVAQYPELIGDTEGYHGKLKQLIRSGRVFATAKRPLISCLFFDSRD